MTEALLDTHCHITEYRDPTRVLAEAASVGVHVVVVTEDPGQYRLLRTRLGSRAGVEVALGFHPLRAGASTDDDVTRMLRLLPQARWIGEVGLDFSRVGLESKKAQLRLFDTLLAEAVVCSRPMTVHSRGAASETVKRLLDAGAHAIMHWYTGPLDVAEQALAGGLYFSVNPAMPVSKSGSALLRLLPSDRVLLETDGPYARTKARPSHPHDVVGLVATLASRWSVSVAEAEAGILRNQERFLGETSFT